MSPAFPIRYGDPIIPKVPLHILPWRVEVEDPEDTVFDLGMRAQTGSLAHDRGETGRITGSGMDGGSRKHARHLHTTPRRDPDYHSQSIGFDPPDPTRKGDQSGTQVTGVMFGEETPPTPSEAL